MINRPHHLAAITHRLIYGVCAKQGARRNLASPYTPTHNRLANIMLTVYHTESHRNKKLEALASRGA